MHPSRRTVRFDNGQITRRDRVNDRRYVATVPNR